MSAGNLPEIAFSLDQRSHKDSQDYPDVDQIDAATAKREAEIKRSGVVMPDDDYKPWVIIIDSMCTRQAWQLGPILGAHGVHGVFQSGPMAQQLAGIWCHPQEPDPKARYKRRKK